MKQFLVTVLVLFGLTPAVQAAQRGGGGQPGRGSQEARAPRETIARDDPKAGLAASEAQAAEAEKAGRWDEAADSYINAARAARGVAQPQKAIDYGIKA